MNEQHTKLRAVDTILRKGVKVPIVRAPLFFRILGRRRMSITLRQPSMGGLLKIARLVVEMNLSPEDFKDLTTAECYKLIDAHGDKALQIVAISVLRYPPFVWGYKWLARWLRWRVEPSLFAYAVKLVLTINEAGDFTESIRSLCQLESILSPKNQGSHEDE